MRVWLQVRASSVVVRIEHCKTQTINAIPTLPRAKLIASRWTKQTRIADFFASLCLLSGYRRATTVNMCITVFDRKIWISFILCGQIADSFGNVEEMGILRNMRWPRGGLSVVKWGSMTVVCRFAALNMLLYPRNSDRRSSLMSRIFRKPDRRFGQFAQNPWLQVHQHNWSQDAHVIWQNDMQGVRPNPTLI